MIGWLGASSIVALDDPEPEADFIARVTASLPIITFRLRLRQRLGYTDVQSGAIGSKAECIQLLLAACPFF